MMKGSDMLTFAQLASALYQRHLARLEGLSSAQKIKSALTGRHELKCKLERVYEELLAFERKLKTLEGCSEVDWRRLEDALAGLVIAVQLSMSRTGGNLEAAIVRRFNEVSARHNLPHVLTTAPPPASEYTPGDAWPRKTGNAGPTVKEANEGAVIGPVPAAKIALLQRDLAAAKAVHDQLQSLNKELLDKRAELIRENLYLQNRQTQYDAMEAKVSALGRDCDRALDAWRRGCAVLRAITSLPGAMATLVPNTAVRDFLLQVMSEVHTPIQMECYGTHAMPIQGEPAHPGVALGVAKQADTDVESKPHP